MPTDSREILSSSEYFDQLRQDAANVARDIVDKIARRIFDAFEDGQTLFVFGNGGSASLASHFACDIGKGTSSVCGSLKRIRALALTDNIPTITAWANDSSYEDIFAEQLQNLVAPDDIAFGISCSGNSPNVLKALALAREMGATTIGLGGFQGGKMKALCDLCLIVPSDNMQIIEDLHLSIAHAIFTIIKNRISMDSEAKKAVAVGATT